MLGAAKASREMVDGLSAAAASNSATERPMRGPEEELQQKVEHLVSLRSADGYMAGSAVASRWLAAGAEPLPDSKKRKSCAETCPHFCQSELRMFQGLLGPGAEVEQDRSPARRRPALRLANPPQ